MEGYPMSRGSIVRWTALTAGVLALGLAGCESTPKSGTDGSSSKPTGSEFDQGSVPSGSGGGSSTSLETVYFDFDRAEIRADARSALQSNASAIKGNTSWGTVTVEGHCDERGSEEYNLALGDRRANAVKRYLVDLGVPSSRLRTVSFGEAKPAVVGHDESAWRYNRRSEFKSES
jgi:peptidoglycan-associated lipoprotein